MLILLFFHYQIAVPASVVVSKGIHNSFDEAYETSEFEEDPSEFVADGKTLPRYVYLQRCTLNLKVLEELWSLTS